MTRFATFFGANGLLMSNESGHFGRLGPVAASGLERWWLERLAKMREDFPDRPGLRDECDQPDVAAAVRARKWKLLPDPRHQFGPRNP